MVLVKCLFVTNSYLFKLKHSHSKGKQIVDIFTYSVHRNLHLCSEFKSGYFQATFCETSLKYLQKNCFYILSLETNSYCYQINKRETFITQNLHYLLQYFFFYSTVPPVNL